MVLLALVLVVLMIFAAFSVDIGTAYAQRRQNQGAVDTAALAGGVYFLYKDSNFESVVKEVKDRVALDMGTKIEPTDWATCTDPGHLPILSTAANYAPEQGNPCISFEESEDTGILRMRVRLPDVASKTSFSGVIGIDKLKTHAVAEVNIGSLLGGAFPALVYSGAGAGEVVCVAEVPPGQGGYCTKDLGQGGNFGMYAPYYYAAGWKCDSGNTGKTGLGPAIAEGLDHFLTRYGGWDPVTNSPTVPGRVNGGPNGKCDVRGPNTIQEGTGNKPADDINAGLIVGGAAYGHSYDGRLAGGPYRGSENGDLNQAWVSGREIDNAPLWYFLLSPAELAETGAPQSCKDAKSMSPRRDNINMASVAGGTYGSPEELMAKCLKDWTTSVGPIFKAEVAESRRTVSVPRTWQDASIGNSGGVYQVRDFVPMFLTAEFNKDHQHWTGSPIAKNAWGRIDGLAGTYVPCGAMPKSVCVPTGDPTDNGFGGDVQGVTLSG